ncbi:hypothetical protein POX_c04173 [Penicillium oxalicum]|uniref:hypothetical protein n=1 Tax=Penicillium oxalicum TaxID=69781 RepID=UPI0020B8D421|nr:hypothetical protein POX_c04173 [Penicillium oxalicum]KAI2791316.1 hypothetical protein POX_c04173 [Penicillium oxalicum]
MAPELLCQGRDIWTVILNCITEHFKSSKRSDDRDDLCSNDDESSSTTVIARPPTEPSSDLERSTSSIIATPPPPSQALSQTTRTEKGRFSTSSTATPPHISRTTPSPISHSAHSNIRIPIRAPSRIHAKAVSGMNSHHEDSIEDVESFSYLCSLISISYSSHQTSPSFSSQDLVITNLDSSGEGTATRKRASSRLSLRLGDPPVVSFPKVPGRNLKPCPRWSPLPPLRN